MVYLDIDAIQNKIDILSFVVVNKANNSGSKSADTFPISEFVIVVTKSRNQK